MGRKKNVQSAKKEEKEEKKVVEEQPEDDEEEMEDEAMDEEMPDDEDDSDEGKELMDDDVDKMEKLNFDFEAFPPDSGDVPGLVNLLTQIFLRSDVDCESLAKALVEMSPIGCVYRPAEECMDEDDDNVVYGVLSMVDLIGPEKFRVDISNLILNRARKFASNEIIKKFEDVFNASKENKNFLLVNERMLHFPDQIAAPAFKSFKDDLKEGKLLDKIENFVLISKVRIPDTALSQTSTANLPKIGGKKKLGKAEKKRRAAAALVNADVEYENTEEALLFTNANLINPVYFQYNVEGDVEKDSKFSTIFIGGVAHRPYRRVTILTKDEFIKFVDLVSQMA
uniref:Protein BCCIP homolog n=1 Tax=Panagrolaimus sp. JU765 TaxID=591449 RepID=A0AC34R056_9BILA